MCISKVLFVYQFFVVLFFPPHTNVVHNVRFLSLCCLLEYNYNYLCMLLLKRRFIARCAVHLICEQQFDKTYRFHIKWFITPARKITQLMDKEMVFQKLGSDTFKWCFCLWFFFMISLNVFSKSNEKYYIVIRLVHAIDLDTFILLLKMINEFWFRKVNNNKN